MERRGREEGEGRRTWKGGEEERLGEREEKKKKEKEKEKEGSVRWEKKKKS